MVDGLTVGMRRSRGPIVGRDDVIDRLVALLVNHDVRVVSLTGPAGVGKTRVAIETLARVAADFADGATFVPLESVSDPDEVLPAIARVFGLQDRGVERAEARLVHLLQQQRALIVLDTVEHVIGAVPALSTLLAACPGVTILATSRISLRMTGEREIPITPLVVDASDKGAALALFEQRARAVRPDFRIDASNREFVAEICRRLDGLPLAIELAAARSKTLSPKALLARLSSRLELLTGGFRDVPARQQTMRDAIAWSEGLLTNDQRRLFRGLSVFAGPFTLDAAESIAGAPAIEELSALVDANLVFATETDGNHRFAMLGVVREFAAGLLASAPELSETRTRHARWVENELALAVEGVWGADQAMWLDHVEQLHVEIRAACVWLFSTDPTAAMRILVSTWVPWQRRGHLAEAERLLSIAIDRCSPDDPTVPMGRIALSSILTELGAPTRALELAMTAREDSRAAGDRPTEGWADFCVSFARSRGGDFAAAEAAAHIANEIAREVGDERLLGVSYNRLGLTFYQQGRWEEADKAWRQALTCWKRLEHHSGYGIVQGNRATMAHARGDEAEAAHLFAEALTISIRQQEIAGIAENLAGVGMIAAATGNAREAALLFGAAEALRDRAGILSALDDDQIIADAMSCARDVIGDGEFRKCFAEGRLLSILEAHQLAADAAARLSALPASSSAASSVEHALSPREVEVLGLLASGKNSRQIGAALFISPRTVTTHVGHIFEKLDVDSRASAVARAYQLGIL